MLPRSQKGAQRASFDQSPPSAPPSSQSRPRRSSREARALLRAIAISLPALLLLPGLAVPASARDTERTADRVVARDLRPGDLLDDHGLTVRVPGRGGFVWGELKLRDGTWQEVAVETAVDGTVYVRGRGNERRAVIAARRRAAAETTAAGTAATGVMAADPDAAADARRAARGRECRDDFRNLYWWRLPRLEWRFNPAGTPAYLLDEDGSTTSVQAALQRAQDNVTSSANRCGRPDRVSAKGALVGLGKGRPDIAGTARCLGGNGRSVIQFGSLPSYSIAMTCVYGIGSRNIAGEADIRINSVGSRWATGMASCKGEELLLEAAMTHEFGHAYGLAHASTYRNPTLTMQPLVRACSQGHSSLGLGDMLGLEKKY